MKNLLLKIVFAVFALCMLGTSVAFNLEMIKLTIILFAATLISAGALILADRKAVAEEEVK